MTYATRDNLVARYGEEELIRLTDRDQVGAVDETVLAEAIATADSEIDGAAQDAGYTLPLTGLTDERVVRHAQAMVRYVLAADLATKRMEDDYKEALDFCSALRKGQVRLAGVQSDSPATAGEASISSDDAYMTGRGY